MSPPAPRRRRQPPLLWLFDLDDTLHDATHAAFPYINQAMTDYIARHLDLPHEQANALRTLYWQRHGATLIGLVNHHGVQASHFLKETHLLPGLENRLRASPHDRAALRRLPGRKVLLTNAPRAYAMRVLGTLRLLDCFDELICVEDMTLFGQLRPKPDVRLLRHLGARLKTPPRRCVLVEDCLSNQRAARRVGWRTAWMQRYLRPKPGAPHDLGHPVENTRKATGHHCAKPGYVCARIKRLRSLRVFCG